MHSAFLFVILMKQQKTQYFSPNRSHVADSPENPLPYLKQLSQKCHPAVVNWINVSWPDVYCTYILICFHTMLCSLKISHSWNRDGRRKWRQRRMRQFAGTGKRLAPAEGMGLVLCLKAERWGQNTTELAWKEKAWRAPQINTDVRWKVLKFWLLSLWL